jgi:hypothetical protein
MRRTGLRYDLDVSKPLWGEACLTMGREQAAIALAVVSTKDPTHFRTTPGGYFHGMVAKAKAGELNLDRTLWAMRRAAEPKPPPKTANEGGLRRPRAQLWDWPPITRRCVQPAECAANIVAATR